MSDYIEKIRALRAKAADDASSEAEVETAAAMASKLMAKFGITEAEINDAAKAHVGLKEGAAPQPTNQIQHAVQAALFGIEIFTETKCWIQTNHIYQQGKRVKHIRAKFAGFEGDIEMAFYLVELVRGAADRAWKLYYAAHPEMKEWAQYPRKMRMEAFKTGFGSTVGLRLQTMAEERQEAARQETGTSLVLHKQAVIESFMEQLNITLRENRARGRSFDASAYRSGSSAGARLNLGRPIERGEGATRLK